MSVLPCCFSLRVRPVHVVQAPCRVLKRPDSSAASRFDSGIFKEAEWGVLNLHPLTMTQKMPKSGRWRRVCPCQFRVTYRRYITRSAKELIQLGATFLTEGRPKLYFFKMLLLISACVNACTAIPASNLYTEHSLFEGRLSIHA